MKNTISTVAFMGTVLLTWMGIAFVGYMLSDLEYRDCMVSNASLLIMLLVGWVPAVIVSYDINEYLDK